jgi:hypothetical protein
LWRRQLQDELRAANCPYDMLGHFDYPYMEGYDAQTDARGSTGPIPDNPASNSFVIARPSILTQPDIVFVVIGTIPIGVWEGNSALVPASIAEMDRGLREVAELSPDSLIVVGAIPTNAVAPNAIAAYNAALAVLAAELQADGLRLEFFDARIRADELVGHMTMSDAANFRFGEAAYAAAESFVLGSGACG